MTGRTGHGVLALAAIGLGGLAIAIAAWYGLSPEQGNQPPEGVSLAVQPTASAPSSPDHAAPSLAPPSPPSPPGAAISGLSPSTADLIERADTERRAKRFDEAERLYREGFAAAQAGGARDERLIHARRDFAMMLNGQKRRRDAETEYLAGLAQIAQWYGESHAQWGVYYQQLGFLYRAAARHRESRDAFRQAYEHALATRGPAYPITIGNLLDTAQEHEALNEADDALRAYREAESMARKAGSDKWTAKLLRRASAARVRVESGNVQARGDIMGCPARDPAPIRTECHIGLGKKAIDAGRMDDARAQYTRALENVTTLAEFPENMRAPYLQRLAVEWFGHPRVAETGRALEMLGEVEESWSRIQGPEGAAVSMVHHARATVLGRANPPRLEEADTEMRRFVAIREKLYGADSGPAASAHAAYARTLTAWGLRERAVEQAEHALALAHVHFADKPAAITAIESVLERAKATP